jgi:uncharacterized protein with HEPN domain
MKAHKDRELLHSILEASGYIDQHVSNACNDFTRERAIIFELVTIGEAVSQLSSQLKNNYPKVEWRLISDARNRMVHNYEAISSKIVWDIVRAHLPLLVKEITLILSTLEGE